MNDAPETAEAPPEDGASRHADDLTVPARRRNASDDTARHYAVNLVYCTCGRRLVGHLGDDPMTTNTADVLAEIRERHWALPARGGSADIEWLLTEVERLRAVEAAARQALDWFELSAGDYYRLHGHNYEPTERLRAALTAKPSPSEDTE